MCVLIFCTTWVYSMQCACAVVSSVACLALQYFLNLSHKQHDFLKNVKNVIETCVLIFCTTCGRNIAHPKKNLARYCHKCSQVIT